MHGFTLILTPGKEPPQPKKQKVWYVNLPLRSGMNNPDYGWECVAEFQEKLGKTRQSAEQFLKNTWGIPSEHAEVFIFEKEDT
jgi:hypothetical protein